MQISRQMLPVMSKDSRASSNTAQRKSNDEPKEHANRLYCGAKKGNIMKITLKDGSIKEYAQPMAIIDVIKDISEGLAAAATLALVDGEEKDLRKELNSDCQLTGLTAKDAAPFNRSCFGTGN